MTKTDTIGRSIVDRPLVDDVIAFHSHKQSKHTKGWIYSHACEQLERNGYGPEVWPKTLSFLASCDSLDEAQGLQRAGWVTARVIDRKEDKAPNELLCPYDVQRANKVPADKRTNCARCRLCYDGKNRNIAFIKF